MNLTLECSAILFDLDGTLIHSIAAVDRAWSKWCVRHGLNPADVLPNIHGKRAIDSIKRFAPSPNVDLDAEMKWLEAVESEDTEGIVEVPGGVEFVRSVPISRWAIVTSGTSPVAKARLKAVDLQPETAVFGEEVKNGKPFPDPYLEGARRLGVPPQECLVFEDTAAGVQSAQAAGMRVVAVAGESPYNQLEGADAVIASYLGCSVTSIPGGLRVDVSSLK